MKRIWIGAVVFSFLFVAYAAAQQSGDDILKSLDQAMNNYKDLKVSLTMISRAPDGSEKKFEMANVQKGSQRITKFLSPPSERGIGFLSVDAETTFVYLPSYGKIRRIAGHVRNQTFMGTDLSYDDQSVTYYGDIYAAKLLEATEQQWVLELTPKPDKTSGYAKIKIWADRSKMALTKLEYYNAKGEAIKVEERFDFYQLGKLWTIKKFVITDLKTKHQTIVTLRDQQLDTGVSDEMFTQRQLKRMD